MEDLNVLRQLSQAIDDNNVVAVRDSLHRYPDLLKEKLNYFLRVAAPTNHVDIMALFVEFGADVNAPQLDGSPEGPIDNAAGNGALEAVKWLLDHGAKVNHQVRGVTRCFALSGAVINGHLDVVKLLVEHGANINAVWTENNALSFAIMYGRKEIEAYLRSQGALEPSQPPGYKPPVVTNPILQHAEVYFGKISPLSLQDIVPTSPPISIHVARNSTMLTLFTRGMSDQPLTVPAGYEAYRFAELVIFLPPDWPVNNDTLRDPNSFWPIEWLRRIAHYPHDHRTWLGGPTEPSIVMANGEPPQPLAPNTNLTSVLAMTDADDLSQVQLADGRTVVFYSLYPLYTEERELEKEKGVASLLELFHKHEISRIVNVHRPNVVGARPGQN